MIGANYHSNLSEVHGPWNSWLCSGSQHTQVFNSVLVFTSCSTNDVVYQEGREEPNIYPRRDERDSLTDADCHSVAIYFFREVQEGLSPCHCHH